MRRTGRPTAGSDEVLSARLSAALKRLAPNEGSDADAVAELAALTGDRVDLLARAAGLIRGASPAGRADSPWWDRAVRLAVAAGADQTAIAAWRQVGEERARARHDIRFDTPT